jgi:hypothetical protein
VSVQYRIVVSDGAVAAARPEAPPADGPAAVDQPESADEPSRHKMPGGRGVGAGWKAVVSQVRGVVKAG